jgi:hypothetical protein
MNITRQINFTPVGADTNSLAFFNFSQQVCAGYLKRYALQIVKQRNENEKTIIFSIFST